MAHPRLPPFGNHDVINTSRDVSTSRCEPQRKRIWTYCISPKCHYISFNSLKVIEGGGIHPLGQRRRKNPHIGFKLLAVNPILLFCSM